MAVTPTRLMKLPQPPPTPAPPPRPPQAQVKELRDAILARDRLRLEAALASVKRLRGPNNPRLEKARGDVLRAEKLMIEFQRRKKVEDELAVRPTNGYPDPTPLLSYWPGSCAVRQRFRVPGCCSPLVSKTLACRVRDTVDRRWSCNQVTWCCIQRLCTNSGGTQ
jgi:hypothetical protein